MMRVRRLPVVDAYSEDGRTAVYADSGEVVALSELASWAWSSLGDGWTHVTQLAQELVAEFGEPEGIDPVAATEDTVRALVGHGLAELQE